MRVLLVIDPIAGLKPAKDTSLGLMREAQARGHQCFIAEPQALGLRDGQPFGHCRSIRVDLDTNPFYQLGEHENRPLADFGCLLMRKDPPVDDAYIWATQIMGLAASANTRVHNAPAALLGSNEKLAIARFPEHCAPTLCSAKPAELRSFAQQHGDVIFKPLDGMGGRSIFRIKPGDANLNVVIETLTRNGRDLAMAQAFLPAIRDGDKRVLIIDGEPWPRLLARIPSQGENRGNLAAGGRGEVRDLSEADRAIAASVGPWLREMGVAFAGIDVIGDKLTEVNITSPTCVREIEAADGSNICAALWDAFERRE